MLKIPFGLDAFAPLRSRGYYYFDKTEGLRDLIEQGERYFLARPSGYGKTLTLSTLAAMFEGKIELFQGLAAQNYVKDQSKKTHPVLSFDLSSLNFAPEGCFEEFLNKILAAQARKFGLILPEGQGLQSNLYELLHQVFDLHGELVILIDNYESPFQANLDDSPELFKRHRIIQQFYQLLQSNNALFRFLLILGQEPYMQFGLYATLPGLSDLTLQDSSSKIIGVNIDELTEFAKISTLSREQRSYLLNILEDLSGKFEFATLNVSSLWQGMFQSGNKHEFKYQENFLRSKAFYYCLNQDDDFFVEVINSTVYVDKSELLIHTNDVIETNNKYVCISRPRRFGKTISANMVVAYYDINCNAAKTFSRLKISKHQSFTLFANRYIVLKITVQDYLSKYADCEEIILNLKHDIVCDLRKRYYMDEKISDLNQMMSIVHGITSKKFVIVIDEWDCILREYKNKEDWQRKYLDFLRYWFKDNSFIALVYMTGILPIKKYGSHSALNMFNEYSMISSGPFARYVGFTEDEVVNLCNEFNRDWHECQKWYDGYQIDNVKSIYNPRSVSEAVRTGEFRTYWNNTETYEALQIYLSLDSYGLHDTVIKLLASESVRIDPSTFANDMQTFNCQDDVLTLLLHLGYLSFDAKSSSVRIPNAEVSLEFVKAIKNKSWPHVVAAIENSARLLSAVLRADSETVAKGIACAHLETSHLQYNDENALAYTISLAFYTAREHYSIIRELPTGKGFADLVFLPRVPGPWPTILVELKWDKLVSTAIKQIHEREYPKALKGCSSSLILVGVTYDKKTREHQCIIEQTDLSK